MRQHSIRWIVLALAVACAGCDSNSPSPTTPHLPAGPVAMVVLSTTQSSGVHGSRRQVIREDAAFAAAWDEIFEPFLPPPPRPEVDFEQSVVAIAASGERPNGCYLISADEAFSNGVHIVVRVTESEPGPLCSCTANLVEPVAVVQVPRAGGDVVFETRTETLACE